MTRRILHGECAACQQERALFRRGLCSRCYHDRDTRAAHALPLRRQHDIAGMTFNRLTVLSRTERPDSFGKRTWLCRCECGATVILATGALTTGNTKSCGCWKLERLVARVRTHGMSKTAIYRIWCLIRSRCHDPGSQDYGRYGGRGIKVCERWRESFEAFRDDVGERPSPKHELDRIDNDGDYEPGNCRWATRREQCNNKSSNLVIEHDGVSRTLMEWATLVGIDQRLISRRLRRGLPPAEALKRGDRRASTGSGSALSSERGTWYAMIRRCTDRRDEAYSRYGGRGIVVCERWLGPGGFANFLADMGYRPGKAFSLERIDVDGPYSPENCRWATRTEQARNTRRNRRLAFRGETLCVSEWAERLGIPPWKISQRLGRGWTAERALSTP